MAAQLDKGFNLNVFLNAIQRHSIAQIDKIIVPYNGTRLLKRPI